MKRKLLLAATISIAALALTRMPLVAAADVAVKPDLARAKQIPKRFAQPAMAPTATAQRRPTPTWPGRARSI